MSNEELTEEQRLIERVVVAEANRLLNAGDTQAGKSLLDALEKSIDQKEETPCEN